MRKWLVVLMTAAAVALTGTMVWMYTQTDRKGPEILIGDEKENTYAAGMTDEELLESVTAVDEQDGDVSDSLAVETVYADENSTEVTVVYVAKDESNNVTKFTYHMTAGAAEKDSSKSKKASSDVSKDSKDSKDSNLSKDSNVSKETPNEESESDDQGSETESSTDVTPTPEEKKEEEKAEEEKAKEREEGKIEKLNPGDPRFYLSTYYLEVAKGTQLDDLLNYVKTIEDDKDETNDLFRKIQITGTVDTNTAGTYELTYFVLDSDGNASNGAVLTVVVQ